MRLLVVVDVFILSESNSTYSGKSKPLHFKENMHRLQPYLHKIVHLVIEGMSAGDNAWEREEFQRNKMDRAFRGEGR